MTSSVEDRLRGALAPAARRVRRGARRLRREAVRVTHRPLAEIYYRWVFPDDGKLARRLKSRVRAWEEQQRAYEIPRDRGTWENQFREGFWDFMDTDPLQAGRYALAAGYIRFFVPRGARILDVGCGEGGLLDYLRPEDVRSYRGFDLSEAAVSTARQRYGSRGARFRQADASTFEPSSAVDVIVFNGVLMYMEAPLEQARRYAGHLAPGGLVVLVTYRGSERARGILWCLRDEWSAVVSSTCRAEGPLPTPGPVPYDWTCTVLTPAELPMVELAGLRDRDERRRVVADAPAPGAPGRWAGASRSAS